MYMSRLSRFGILDLPALQAFWVTASSTVLSQVYASYSVPKFLSFGTVDNGSWRRWQAESAWYLWFQKKHRLHWRCIHAGAAPQSCSIRSISSHSPLIADNNSESCLHSVLFFPYGKDGCAPLPLPGSGSPRRTGLLPQ